MDQGKINAYNEEKRRQQERGQELAKFDELSQKIEKLASSKLPVVQVDGTDLGARVGDLKQGLTEIAQILAEDRTESKAIEQLASNFETFVNQLILAQESQDNTLEKSLNDLKKSVDNIEVKPVVNTPKITVPETKIDLAPVADQISKLKTGIQAIKDSIESLSFPVPNYVLPFQTDVGKATQVKLTSSGSLPVDIGSASVNITGPVTVSNEVEIKNDTGSPVPVSASSLPLPSGAATAALQTQPGVDIGDVTINNASGASAVNIQDGGNSITIDQPTGTNLHTVLDSGTLSTITNVVHVDDNSGSLTVDYATTGSGTATGALRVELPTNGTGVVGLNTGTNSIGDVRSITTSVTPGTGATNLGKAEDAVHATGDAGVMALAVRSNTAASTSGTDGDYQPLITNTTGHLWVDASGQTLTVASHAVTNAGTFAVQAAQSGTWNIGTVTTLTGITNVVHVDDNAGSLTVDNNGTFAVQATIASGATSIAKAEDVASADADVGVPSMAVRKAAPANTSGTDGDYEMLQMSAGRLWVDASGKTLTVDGSGVTQPVSGTFWQATQPVSLATNTPSGSVAHDGVGTAVNPLLVGGYASAAAPTDVSADGDATRAWFLRNGAQATVLTAAGALIGGDATNGLDVDVTRMSALVAGSALIGKVGIDQTTVGTTNAVSVSQIGSATVSTGNGLVGTGVQRVAIASDNTAFSVNAAQSGTWNVTNVSGTVSLPTGASTSANQTTEITSLQLLDDVIIADNAAFTDGTTKVSMAGFIYDEVAGTALTENDAAAGRINANRALVSAIEDGATRGRYATVSAANALKVDGSAVTQPVSAASLPLPTGAATSANQTNGSQLIQIVDAGLEAVTVTGGKLDVNATLSGTSGGTSSIDDAAFNVAVDSGTPAMGLADMVAPDSVNEGDVGVMRMSLARVQLGHIWDAAGNERGLNVDANGAIAVTATNATASNLKVASTLDAETTKVIGTVRNLGNGGATLDSTVGAGTAPTNQLVVGALYNSTEISPTTGQAFALQADSKGRLRNVIMDAAGNTRGANVNASNQLSVSVDNSPSVTATLSAETTKVIGVVRNADGSGNLLTSTGNALDVNTELPTAAAAADGATNPTAPFVVAANSVFNGTTWDRTKGAVDATNSTGTGLQAIANLAQFDDYQPTAITENQFGNLRMSSNRNLYGQIRDAGGNERGAKVDQSGRLSVSVDNVANTNIDAIGGSAVATNLPGVQLVQIADDVGGVTGSQASPLVVSPTNNYLNATTTATGPRPYVNTALTNSIVNVGTGKVNLYGYHIYNSNTSVAYVQIFNGLAGSLTLGTSPAAPILAIPAGGWADAPPSGTPITTFSSGLSLAATTTATGSAAPTTALLVNLFIA